MSINIQVKEEVRMYKIRVKGCSQARDINWEVISIEYVFKVIIMDNIVKRMSAYRDEKSKD